MGSVTEENDQIKNVEVYNGWEISIFYLSNKNT